MAELDIVLASSQRYGAIMVATITFAVTTIPICNFGPIDI